MLTRSPLIRSQGSAVGIWAIGEAQAHRSLDSQEWGSSQSSNGSTAENVILIPRRRSLYIKVTNRSDLKTIRIGRPTISSTLLKPTFVNGIACWRVWPKRGTATQGFGLTRKIGCTPPDMTRRQARQTALPTVVLLELVGFNISDPYWKVIEQTARYRNYERILEAHEI